MDFALASWNLSRDEVLDSSAGPVVIPAQQGAVRGKGGAGKEGVDLIPPAPRGMIVNRLANHVDEQEPGSLDGRVGDWRCG